MKYIKQFAIIILFSFIGELLNKFIPLPVPASVYGMVLLLVALLLGIVKLSWVEDVADFFLAVMPIFFVAPTIRLMDEYVTVLNCLVPFLVICAVSTFAAFICCGVVATLIIKLGEKKEEKR